MQNFGIRSLETNSPDDGLKARSFLDSGLRESRLHTEGPRESLVFGMRLRQIRGAGKAARPE